MGGGEDAQHPLGQRYGSGAGVWSPASLKSFAAVWAVALARVRTTQPQHTMPLCVMHYICTALVLHTPYLAAAITAQKLRMVRWCGVGREGGWQLGRVVLPSFNGAELPPGGANELLARRKQAVGMAHVGSVLQCTPAGVQPCRPNGAWAGCKAPLGDSHDL
jgi:hypothetical protein